MCGLLGSVNIAFDRSTLDMIAHRGPDASGFAEYRVGRHAVTIAHRRLSILDLSPAGSQPMESFCRQYSIVYNGEVYNHLGLRDSLQSVSYRGHSDTETILNSIAQSGINVVRDFNGIFAFAFVDLHGTKLYLARDQFGVKPLYYHLDGNRLVFGSEMKPVLDLAQDTVDLGNLAEVLQLRYSPSPHTLFRNIRKVRPGHIVEINLAGDDLEIREYPYLDKCPGRVKLTFGEAVERYEELFTSAVNRQLMSDVEVGVLLSGGVDSALVASSAQFASDYRMKAFTVGFSDQDNADEIADAAETARVIGLDHYSTRISFSDFLDMVRKCVQIVEEPLATTSIIPMYYLSSLAAEHVKVVLSGQGADESLGGYGRYQGELYQRFIPALVARVAEVLAKSVGTKKDQLLRGLHALGEPGEIQRFIRAYAVFSGNEAQRLVGCTSSSIEGGINYFRDVLGCDDLKTSAERMMALDLRMNLSDDLLLYTDKITMHHSLECRVPMLDLDLVRFIESLPREYRVKLGDTKRVHKACAKKILPSALVNRKKKGFISPTQKWFKHSGVLKEILLSANSRFSNYFDLAEVNSVLVQHEKGFNRERHIFLLLTLYFWLDEFS
mgnify:CR=1 FL=1